MGLYLGLYKTYSCKIALKSTLKKTYNYEVNASGIVQPPEIIITEKSYEYGQYSGLPTKITTKTSNLLLFIIKITFYKRLLMRTLYEH